FDRPMDRESVENALNIEPALDGGYFVWYQNTKTYSYNESQQTYSWDGMYMREGGAPTAMNFSVDTAMYVPSAQITTYSVAKSFTFYFPRAGCYTDTTYTVTISTDAVDTAGTPLDSALELTFKTVQSAIAYSDVEMVPHDGDDWVSPFAPNGIRITFPRRMNEASVEAHTHVNLAPDAVFLWHDYNNVTLYTGGLFVPETTYVVTIDSAALDLDGEPLGETKELSFQTAPIRVVSTAPARAQLGVNTQTDITMRFNTYMDRTTFAGRSWLVSDAGDTVGGSINYRYHYDRYAQDTTFYLDQVVFTPYAPLTRNTFYTFRLGPGATDLNGYGMRTCYDIEFITMP
ncbi:MAG: hypothetical protein GF331_26475, partial [Chitinivibrionales bacterium]|nr:hypothetical protein [Chitinivibrionales bacterium]